MSEYCDFAQVYDVLMCDVDYHKRALYLMKLFKRFDRMPTLLLDVACGTGGFSNEFAKSGVEVIGVDMSEDMLDCARRNSAECGTDVLFLCQKAQELDLYGTVDGAICCLDSLNHITDYRELCKAIKRVSLFLEEDRLFIFDVNTLYKHKHILGNNTFVIEHDDVFCTWQNEFDEKKLMTDISLDFFVKDGEKYIRSSEDFSERAYTESELENALQSAGLKIEAIYADMIFDGVKSETDRAIYITRKVKENING